MLGGGGSAGNAWLIGVVAGLAEGGVDVTTADLVVGTSAGATAAAQVTGAAPAALLSAVLEAPPPGPPGGSTAGRRRPPGAPAVDHLARTAEVIAAASDAADMRRRMGASAMALDAGSDAARHARWRDVVAARLPATDWPDRPLLLTAVDARTGQPVVLDRDSGIGLADAVAASCSSGAPHAVGDARFIDGGYRRNENADLADGFGRVLVLSPLGGRTRHPLAWGMQLAAQVEELRQGGSRVETVLPDAASLAAFGDDLMAPATRPPAARAGYAQGIALAPSLATFWA